MRAGLLTPRAAIMAVFAAFGAIFGTFAGSVPQLVAHYGLSNASYGLGVTVMSAATVGSMGLSGFLARHFSHRDLLVIFMPLTMGLMALLFTSTSLPMFFILAPLMGMTSGVMDVIMNAEGGAIEVDLKRPVYTAFHGSASLSVAIFAIVSSILSTNYGTPASIACAACVVAVAMAMVYSNIPPREKNPALISPVKLKLTAAFTRPLILIGVAAGLIIAAEVTALLWSSKLLAETAPQLAAISGLGAAFFGLCNAMVRFPGDQFRARFGEFRIMLSMVLVAIFGFAGLGLTETFAANVFFFALVGMGTAVLCPCLFAMAARQTPHNRAAGLSIAMLVAGAPRIAAPSVFGEIAELTSTRVAFGLCAIVLIVAMLFMNALRTIRIAPIAAE